MTVHWLTLVIGTAISSLPPLLVCVVGMAAALRSRSLPSSAVKLTVIGFGCIVATSPYLPLGTMPPSSCAQNHNRFRLLGYSLYL